MEEAGHCRRHPIGCFHIDIAEVQTAEGKLYLYVAIDRTSKFAFVQLVKKTGRSSPATFFQVLTETVPYKIHIVLRHADGPAILTNFSIYDGRKSQIQQFGAIRL